MFVVICLPSILSLLNLSFDNSSLVFSLMTESLDQQFLCRADHSMNTIVVVCHARHLIIYSIHFPQMAAPQALLEAGFFHWDPFFWGTNALTDFSRKAYCVEEEARETSKFDKLSGRNSNSSNGDFGSGKVPFCFENSLVQRLSRGRHKMSPCWKCWDF